MNLLKPCALLLRTIRKRRVLIASLTLLYLIITKLSNNNGELSKIVDKNESYYTVEVDDSHPTPKYVTSPSASIPKNLVGPEYKNSLPVKYSQAKCAPYQDDYDLEFSNTYWQVLRKSNWTMYLYSAYYDIRERSSSGDMIRIIVLMNNARIVEKKPLWCQIWTTKSSSPKFLKASDQLSIWPPKFGFYNSTTMLPYLISCKVPKTMKKVLSPSTVFAVSLVSEKCDKAKNKLRVYFEPPRNNKRQEFAVCVKGLDFHHKDISVRLIEWIEFLRIMGVHKIYFYEFAVHSNTKGVLNYYVQQGVIDVTPFTLPGFYSNDPSIRHDLLIYKKWIKRRIELVPYNDCFYRLMYQYDYIALLDIDETIVPVRFQNYHEMLNSVSRQGKEKWKNQSISFYGVSQTGCFFEDVKRDWVPEVPSHMHMLQHIYKIPEKYNRSKLGIKGFANPKIVLSILNHQPRPHACLPTGSNCARLWVKIEDAQLQHYRTYKTHCGAKSVQQQVKSCDKLSCQNYTVDKTIWKFKDELILRVNKVMSDLGIPIQPGKV